MIGTKVYELLSTPRHSANRRAQDEFERRRGARTSPVEARLEERLADIEAKLDRLLAEKEKK